MPSDKPDRVTHWRKAVSAVQTVEADAFAELVLEHGLRVVGPYRGYVYAALESEDGFDMYKAYQSKKWVWQSHIVFTQTNAAGGAVKVDYTVASGQLARLVSAYIVNSGTNGINAWKRDEDNAVSVFIGGVASAAATGMYLPSIGASAVTSNNCANSVGMLLVPGEKLSLEQSGAGAQNDTFTISLVLELYNLGTEPTISKARSTNAGSVTQGTDSISDANDLQEFVC